MLETDPQIVPRGDDLPFGADTRVRVRYGLEWFAIKQSANCRGGQLRLWELCVLKHLLPGALRAESAAIEQAPEHRILVLIAQQVKLLFRALVFAREAKQLKQERPFPVIGRIVAKIGTEHPYRFVYLASAE